LQQSKNRKGIIGYPLYIFSMQRGKISPMLGIVRPSEGIYFAVHLKDIGITARMTHSIPSVFCNVNHVGWFEKIIGYDPEPHNFAKIPHLPMSEWTVFFCVS